MGNPRGQAARFAYDPAVFTTFVASKSEYVTTTLDVTRRGRPTTQKAKIRLVNGKHFDQTNDARILLRWRTNTKGISLQGAERFLGRYGMTLDQFEAWAGKQGLRAILWGSR